MTDLGRWAVACAVVVSSATVIAEEPPRFGASIEVSRILTEVRVVTPAGVPVRDLERADFAVSIDGREVEVEAAEFIEGAREALHEPTVSPIEPATGLAATGWPGAGPAPRVGRRILILFQVDFEPTRLTGLYRMSRRARRMLTELDPADRVAVVVYAKHLRLHLDFTTDHQRAADELQPLALVESRRAMPTSEGDSLVAGFDFAAARDAPTMSAALQVLADALATVPGAKDVILFGYGIGRFTGQSVLLPLEYDRAQAALVAARATVFALDITDAGSHSLEVGLRAVAADTGGFYAKTNVHPGIAMRQLQGAIAGHYSLTLVPPDLGSGTFPLDVQVPKAKDVRIYAPPRVIIGG